MPTEHVDVLIVGAGLSGIGAGLPPADATARARRTRSSRRARRSAAPGTCSATPASARTRTCTRSATRSARGSEAEGDRRRPVDPRATSARPRASTASTQQIRFGHRVVRARWSSADARWTVEVAARRHAARRCACTLRFLFMCTRLLPLRRGLHAASSPATRALRRARSCTRSTGPRTSTTPASASS